MRLEKVKNLISEGKTQKAIDLLQEILKEKDAQLLNQTLLLEGQFSELQRKMQLGLQDASAELNRINFTLLSVCDDAANLENIGEDGPEKPLIETEKPSGLLSNPLAIFGIIAALGVAIVLGIFALAGKKEAPKSNLVQPENLTAPTTATPSVNVVESAWQSASNVVNINDKYYGNVKTEVVSVKTVSKNADLKTLTIDLNFQCLKSVSGVCILNYLEFLLVSPSGQTLKPADEVYFASNPKDGSTLNQKVTFSLPNSLKQADLQIYYREKKDKTLATIKISETGGH
ncbi:MAG: hypothetical protein JNL70_25260 [Saprospiraceae bacterium]|nr:hypothetical protein [Saprospiraceae bacterium]